MHHPTASGWKYFIKVPGPFIPRPSSYPLLGPKYLLLGTIYPQLRVQGGSWFACFSMRDILKVMGSWEHRHHGPRVPPHKLGGCHPLPCRSFGCRPLDGGPGRQADPRIQAPVVAREVARGAGAAPDASTVPKQSAWASASAAAGLLSRNLN